MKDKYRYDSKEWRLLKEIRENPKNWTDLVNTKIFSSKRDLSKALKRLVIEGTVVKIKASHKNVKYLLSEAGQRIKRFTGLEESLQIIKMFLSDEKLAHELRERRIDEEPLTSWMTALFIKELEIFLKMLKTITLLPFEYQNLAREQLLGQLVDLLLIGFSFCNKVHPEAVESAYITVENNLLELKRSSPRYLEPIQIIELLEKIEELIGLGRVEPIVK